MKEDAAFMAMYRAGKTMRREEPAVWKQPPVDHSTVFQCRTPDFAWVRHEGEGYSLKLKIAKWETNGCKEIWHADLKKGLKVEYGYPHRGYEMLYVKSGKLEVTIDHSYETAEPQTFTVGADTIVDIPRTTPIPSACSRTPRCTTTAASTTCRRAWRISNPSSATRPSASPSRKIISPSCASTASTPPA